MYFLLKKSEFDKTLESADDDEEDHEMLLASKGR
jgi:hypothetical protein